MNFDEFVLMLSGRYVSGLD